MCVFFFLERIPPFSLDSQKGLKSVHPSQTSTPVGLNQSQWGTWRTADVQETLVLKYK